MADFKGIFNEEARELLEQLEEALLVLENHKQESGAIEQVFRVMHTLKGSSNMFGYDLIGELTHHLETIYDSVRNGERKVTEQLLSLTLRATDHLNRLLDDAQLQNPDLQEAHNRLMNEIQEVTRSTTVTESLSAEKQEQAATWLVSFNPHADIMANGTNPILLIDDLRAIGETYVLPQTQDIPLLSSLSANQCYVNWQILVYTAEPEEELKDVFLFVEDECDLEITRLSENNLLEDDKFIDSFNQLDKYTTEAVRPLLSQQEPKKIDEEPSLDEPGLEEPGLEEPGLAEPGLAEPGQVKRKSENRRSQSGSIRVASDKLDELMNMVSELVTTQARLSLLAEESRKPEFIAIAEEIEKVSRRLRDSTFNICLIPIESLLIRFRRLVRDLSVDLGKEINFITEGADTELDKSVIDVLADPLLHIFRNSIDHGIESEADRLAAGKPAAGTIHLKSYYSGTNVIIEIQDDGKGIDPDVIRNKAIDKGVLPAGANPGRKESLELIFAPGFSTASQVTDLSGRGVGMDVVRRKIQEIRGEVGIESEPGVGTTITISLPLTLSIIDGLLVEISGTRYVIPLMVIDKCYEVNHTQMVKNINGSIVIDGEQLPLFYLRDLFGYHSTPPDIEQVVAVSYEGQRVGLAVDQVIGEYQAVLKPLGKHYTEQDFISGATILGDGTIALVLDTTRAVKSFSQLETH